MFIAQRRPGAEAPGKKPHRIMTSRSHASRSTKAGSRSSRQARTAGREARQRLHRSTKAGSRSSRQASTAGSRAVSRRSRSTKAGSRSSRQGRPAASQWRQFRPTLNEGREPKLPASLAISCRAFVRSTSLNEGREPKLPASELRVADTGEKVALAQRRPGAEAPGKHRIGGVGQFAARLGREPKLPASGLTQSPAQSSIQPRSTKAGSRSSRQGQYTSLVNGVPS